MGWQKRKKHWEDHNAALVACDSNYRPGQQVRTFVAKVFWPKFEELGHSHGDYSLCRCSRD